MINRVNGLNNLDYSINNSIFPKEKLPHFENITITPNSISMNIDANKAQIQELAQTVSRVDFSLPNILDWLTKVSNLGYFISKWGLFRTFEL